MLSIPFSTAYRTEQPVSDIDRTSISDVCEIGKKNVVVIRKTTMMIVMMMIAMMMIHSRSYRL